VIKARAALAEGSFSHALNLVAPWLTDDVTPPIALLLAGRALLSLGRFPEAIGYLEQYLSVQPSCPEGLLAAGVAAAGARELAKAVDWFNKAAHSLSGKARELLEPYLLKGTPDPIAIEDLIVQVESHPDDRDCALALTCALGQAGHFRAIERFLSIIDSSPLS
jgi:tetratricopeptide (TPR) repeat protein